MKEIKVFPDDIIRIVHPNSVYIVIKEGLAVLSEDSAADWLRDQQAGIKLWLLDNPEDIGWELKLWQERKENLEEARSQVDCIEALLEWNDYNTQLRWEKQALDAEILRMEEKYGFFSKTKEEEEL